MGVILEVEFVDYGCVSSIFWGKHQFFSPWFRISLINKSTEKKTLYTIFFELLKMISIQFHKSTKVRQNMPYQQVNKEKHCHYKVFIWVGSKSVYSQFNKSTVKWNSQYSEIFDLHCFVWFIEYLYSFNKSTQKRTVYMSLFWIALCILRSNWPLHPQKVKPSVSPA